MLAASAFAQTVTIKLGTLAPEGSTWHGLLKEMGQRWMEVSGGKVKLKIYPGGVAGSEGDMVRKMRVGQLNAGAFTVVGLHDIESAPQAIACPGLITSQEEWEYVFPRLAPTWEKRFIDKGFVPLMWGDTGWVYLFLRKDIASVKELKGVKIFAWAGDPSAVKASEAAGFQPVVIPATDILPALSTGMIEGFFATPIAAFTARLYDSAKFMPDLSWGHLPGGTVVNKSVWDQIPADLQAKCLAISREIGARVNAEVKRMSDDAMEQMKKNGLQTIRFKDSERKAWFELAERTWPAVRGSGAEASDFDAVKKVRDEFRAQKGRK
jgi:TRAP-type C4-dicarboxylate transport system substrate-binding protein